jgi:NitT/TauT family transport system ATP-binding protein
MSDIIFDHVSKMFPRNGGDLTALEDVSFSVGEREFVAIVGPSGCGKTTLLRIVAGLERPSLGSVRVGGRQVVGPGPDRAMIFQQFALFPWKTVRENIAFGLKCKNVSRQERDRVVGQYLDLLGMAGTEESYPHQLSGGMQQRVAIARSYAIEPEVLLMDEPFGALDTQTRVVMQEILTNIWQQFRISVLFITHDIEESIFLSDRIYVMTARPGRIKAEIKVPLPRPRTAEMTATPEFAALVRKLKGLIREESLAAMEPELKSRGLAGFGMNVGPKGVGEIF